MTPATARDRRIVTPPGPPTTRAASVDAERFVTAPDTQQLKRDDPSVTRAATNGSSQRPQHSGRASVTIRPSHRALPTDRHSRTSMYSRRYGPSVARCYEPTATRSPPVCSTVRHPRGRAGTPVTFRSWPEEGGPGGAANPFALDRLPGTRSAGHWRWSVATSAIAAAPGPAGGVRRWVTQTQSSSSGDARPSGGR